MHEHPVKRRAGHGKMCTLSVSGVGGQRVHEFGDKRERERKREQRSRETDHGDGENHREKERKQARAGDPIAREEGRKGRKEGKNFDFRCRGTGNQKIALCARPSHILCEVSL